MTEMERLGLVELEHPPEWHARREGKITGTTAAAIWRGGESILREWEYKTGNSERDDLSKVWIVHMGTSLQSTIAHAHEIETGVPITEYETWEVHPQHDWWAMNKDGRAGDYIWEAKFSGKSTEDLLNFYAGQLISNTAIGRANNPDIKGWVLSVLSPFGKFMTVQGDYNAAATEQLFERIEHFRHCVKTDTPPVDVESAPDIAISDMKTVSMEGNNLWTVSAADYFETLPAKKKHDAAAKSIRELVAADVREATGHGLTAKRDKRGAIRLFATKEPKS